MSYTQQELDRIVELYRLIEGHKEQAYAAPTYQDSPSLREMGEIVMRHTENDAATLEETLPALRYLTACYDDMGRAGMSVQFYTPLLKVHVQLMEQKACDAEDRKQLESCFYAAVKARNYYGPDACADLVALVSHSLPEPKIRKLLEEAQENRRGFIKVDPVEKTPGYLAVIDQVEQKIEENKTMDFCLEYWNLKATYLAEHGIHWRSPAQLNPGVLFD